MLPKRPDRIPIRQESCSLGVAVKAGSMDRLAHRLSVCPRTDVRAHEIKWQMTHRYD